MSNVEFDFDDENNLRTVLAEFDGDTPPDEKVYLVQRWVYRYGFEDAKRFVTEAEAIDYAMSKSRKNQGRYRVMGPVEKEAEA